MDTMQLLQVMTGATLYAVSVVIRIMHPEAVVDE